MSVTDQCPRCGLLSKEPFVVPVGNCERPHIPDAMGNSCKCVKPVCPECFEEVDPDAERPIDCVDHVPLDVLPGMFEVRIPSIDYTSRAYRAICRLSEVVKAQEKLIYRLGRT